MWAEAVRVGTAVWWVRPALHHCPHVAGAWVPDLQRASFGGTDLA